MFESCFERVEAFKKKFPLTVCWRLKQHSEIIEKHLKIVSRKVKIPK